MPEAPPQPLYTDQASNDALPQIAWYPCDKAESSERGPALLVIPGGGYGAHGEANGVPMAEGANAVGLHSAVLFYRINPQGNPNGPTHPAMLHDAQRAIRLLRDKGWGPIAVLGFSAGGHLAATLTVHHDQFPNPDDELAKRISAKPDALLLGYPVITFEGPHVHAGSRRNLLGEIDQSSEALRQKLSPEQHITADHPPTFLWHTCEDPGVPVENALMHAAAVRAAGVPIELHIYELGRHGLWMAEDHPEAKHWFDLAMAFCKRHLMD